MKKTNEESETFLSTTKRKTKTAIASDPVSDALSLKLEEVKPIEEREEQACRYCGKTFKVVGRHEARCRSNPDYKPSRVEAVSFIPVEMYQLLVRIVGNIARDHISPKCALTDSQVTDLANLWKPVGDYYFPDLERYGPLPMALVGTALIIGSNFLITEPPIPMTEKEKSASGTTVS